MKNNLIFISHCLYIYNYNLFINQVIQDLEKIYSYIFYIMEFIKKL